MDLITLALARQGRGGKDGLSAYEVAKKQGFSGTEKEWLNSLQAQMEYATDNDILSLFTEVFR